MYGDYPQIMKDIVGHRLPKFTDAQKAKLKNSADFVGLNYYTSVFSNHLEKPDPSKPRWMQDSLINWESKPFFYCPYLNRCQQIKRKILICIWC